MTLYNLNFLDYQVYVFFAVVLTFALVAVFPPT